MIRKRNKIMNKLNDGYDRPKGMHNRTYERLMQEHSELDALINSAINGKYGNL
jgi:hypothetical protein